jgi:hypothetical protein
MTAEAVESPPFTIDFAQVFEVSTIQPTPLPTTRAPHRSPIISNSSAVACTDRRVTHVQTKMSKAQKTGDRTSGRGARGQIVCLAIWPAIALKARLLGIVRAEFITEEFPAWGAPRPQFAVYDWQRFHAERTACRCVGVSSECAHQIPPGVKWQNPCPGAPTKIMPRPVGFPAHHSCCEYQLSRVGGRRPLQNRHTRIENVCGQLRTDDGDALRSSRGRAGASCSNSVNVLGCEAAWESF